MTVQNGDIPSMFHTQLNRWNTQIAEAIVFKHPHINIPNKGGYTWIFNFAKRDHPKFMSRPQDLILDRPKQ